MSGPAGSTTRDFHEIARHGISSFFGFPEEDHDNLREWSDAQLYRDEGSPQLNEIGKQANEKLIGYYYEQVQKRRAQPTGDIVGNLMDSDLVQPGGETRRLDDGELRCSSR